LAAALREGPPLDTISASTALAYMAGPRAAWKEGEKEGGKEEGTLRGSTAVMAASTCRGRT
jgi:hypothetical protein